MVSLIILIALLGLVVWAVTTFIPMPPAFKTAIVVITSVCLLLYLLQAFGVWNGNFSLAPLGGRR